MFLLQDFSGYTSGLELFGLVIVFVIVIIACYFVTRFVGGKQLMQQKNSNFTVLETMKLAPNKYLQLIQAGTRYFVISIAKEQISFIAELQKEDITYWKTSQPQQKGFQDILKSLLNKSRTETEKQEQEKVDTHENKGL